MTDIFKVIEDAEKQKRENIVVRFSPCSSTDTFCPHSVTNTHRKNTWVQLFNRHFPVDLELFSCLLDYPIPVHNLCRDWSYGISF